VSQNRRVPPHNLDAETGLLGALTLRPELMAVVRERVGAGDFYLPAHGHIFDTIARLHDAGQPIDPVSLAAELKRLGLLELVGGPAVLLELQAGCRATSSAGRYAEIVAEDAQSRQWIGVLSEVSELLYNGGEPAKAQALVEAELARTTNGRGLPGVHLPEAVDWPRFWAREDAGAHWWIEPIIPVGRMVVIYAQHKLGKSLLTLDMVAAMASGRSALGNPVVPAKHVTYLDLEMTEDDVHERLEDLGYGPDIDLSHLHYYSLPSLPPLDTAEGGRVLRALTRRDGSECVVIDTMAGAVEGEENAADTYRAFHRHTAQPLKADKVTVTRLDHAGKDPTKGQRGASAKGDGPDLVWELTKGPGQSLVLRRTDSRVSWVPEQVTLERNEEPLLRHVVSPYSWPAGTAETAAALTELGIGGDATTEQAITALRKAEKGKRRAAVCAALRYLRQQKDDAA
jgi:hypothetical protein